MTALFADMTRCCSTLHVMAVQNPVSLLSASSRFGCPLVLGCWPRRVIQSSQISRLPSWPSPVRKFSKWMVLPSHNAKKPGDLGVRLTSDLRWNSHVSHLILQSAGPIHLCQKLGYQHSLSSYVIRRFFIAFVRPKLEYCNAVWWRLPRSQAIRLEKLQLKVEKAIVRRRDLSHPQVSKSYVLPNCRPCPVGAAGTTACLHCGTLWKELVHLLSWMLFQCWRAPALCLPCVPGTLCSSHFAPHLVTNPLSFVTPFLFGIISAFLRCLLLHLYCFSALFVTILLSSLCRWEFVWIILKSFFCSLVSLCTCIVSFLFLIFLLFYYYYFYFLFHLFVFLFSSFLPCFDVVAAVVVTVSLTFEENPPISFQLLDDPR